MKIHLQKSFTVSGITVNSIACTGNAFIKGPTVNKEDFEKLMESNKSACCKKCMDKI